MQYRHQQEYTYNGGFYFSLQRNSKKRLCEKERSRICFKSNLIGIRNHEGRSGSSEEVPDLWIKVNRERVNQYKLLYYSRWSYHDPNRTYFRCRTESCDAKKMEKEHIIFQRGAWYKIMLII